MSALPQEGDVAQEAEVVWLEDPNDLDYVRQALDKVNTRKGKPRYERDGRLIGYSNLVPKAPRRVDSGLFARRTFYLLPHDRPNRPDDPECPYSVGSPLEAVDPSTVAPGKVGAKTARSQGTSQTVPAGPDRLGR
ncbi:DUF6009 family protein (plasmid) [Streptomyces sp. NBC_01260]|uniref:DUF6009 family protein n=1 Tax=unclassified Streptomyces TaxID=2593676 RepID=UPI000F4AD2EF|nr:MULTISPECIES: DUF6009 family protein [unclassified Streptomyces]MCX4775242.1 DUF6009 family protein [Streptomyces sp. NBC_01285]ROQ65343.1 hypothetical protein EDD95_7966 [Streptomyces sp. CEV 2-1]RPK33064.1 hypothetical protein EES39_37680 [Streptomyces sp. ADI92-24]